MQLDPAEGIPVGRGASDRLGSWEVRLMAWRADLALPHQRNHHDNHAWRVAADRSPGEAAIVTAKTRNLQRQPADLVDPNCLGR